MARYLSSITLLFVIAMAAGCSKTEFTHIEREPSAVKVHTITVEAGSWLHNFKSYGLVKPAEEYKVGVEVSSTVTEVFFREGQAIESGALLLRLDDKKLQLRLEVARASVEEASADYEQASSSHERNKSIFETGVISEQAFLQSKARLKASGANLRRVTSNHDIATEELADAEVRSPISGVITSRDVEPGQNVSPTSQLGMISLVGGLRVETFLSSKDINFVEQGMEAKVTSPALPGVSFVGVVDQVSRSAEDATGNFEVDLIVKNKDSLLRDGMSAVVEFESTPQQDTLAIPRSAIVDRGRRLVVYRVSDGRAEVVEPVLGVGRSDVVPIYSGLESGDQLIVSPLRLISHGQHVLNNNGAPEG